MKAVILAAGVGSRLGNPYPKTLSVLPNNESILGRQIRILKKTGINEIIVVVGFKYNLIMESFPMVYYKYNPLFYLTNTAKSLLTGVQGYEDDVIWMNADVVFQEETLAVLLEEKEGNIVAVNTQKCGDEEVKYTTDGNQNITQISKTTQNAEGEAVGINIVRKKDLSILRRILEECEDNDYFEKGIEKAIKKGVNFKAVDISATVCMEVDFIEDWDLVVSLMKQRKFD